MKKFGLNNYDAVRKGSAFEMDMLGLMNTFKSP